MLTRFRNSLTGLLKLLAYPFIELGVPPNYLTLASLIFCAFSSLLIVRSAFFYAFFPFAVGALLDALDGTVARAEGKSTKFGAFLDSNLDRYSDGIVLAGFALVYSGLIMRSMVLAAMLGSFLVSYSRAKAESMGVKMEGIGIGERAERLLIIGFTLLFPVLSEWTITILALLSNFTFLQRAYEAYTKLDPSKGLAPP
ncbi:MAG: CDP-alcohol phosphatidyltransferase family protein [Thermoprotei archaeon]